MISNKFDINESKVAINQSFIFPLFDHFSKVKVDVFIEKQSRLKITGGLSTKQIASIEMNVSDIMKYSLYSKHRIEYSLEDQKLMENDQ